MSRPRMLDDWQWDKIKPYLPVKMASRKGGRPRVGDRECLEGILWVLKTGARWRDLPDGFPSASTCWRRLVEWEEEGVLDDLWIAFLDTLDEQGTLRWNEVFLDATFFPAKKGGTTSGPPNEAKAQSWFWWRMARVFLWHVGSRQPVPRKSRSPARRSTKSGDRKPRG